MLVMDELLERILVQSLGAAGLQESDDAFADLGLEQVPLGRVMDEIGPVERGTQHGCVCDFAAVSASHAGIVDVGDGVFLEGVAAVLDGERWATRKPYAGMVAGTDVGVDTKPLLHNALAFFDGSPELRLDPALLVQHALGLRNNDLGTFLGR